MGVDNSHAFVVENRGRNKSRKPKGHGTQMRGRSLETKRLGYVITATSLVISRSFSTVGRKKKVKSKGSQIHKRKKLIKILQHILSLLFVQLVSVIM